MPGQAPPALPGPTSGRPAPRSRAARREREKRRRGTFPGSGETLPPLRAGEARAARSSMVRARGHERPTPRSPPARDPRAAGAPAPTPAIVACRPARPRPPPASARRRTGQPGRSLADANVRPYLPRMGLDARAEAAVTRVVGDLHGALGDQLIGAVLYGSAIGDDWVRGRSDLNLAVLVASVTPGVLTAIVPAVHRWRRRGGALPLVIEPALLTRLTEVFPIEIADILHHHRLLCGRDVFADLTVAPAALRRQLQQ